MKIKPFPVAILQGRLSPDTEGRYQFFPEEGWQKEFETAKELGFDGLEWLIDPNDWHTNPVFSASFNEALRVSWETKLPIVSVCADWFMKVCLWEGDPEAHRSHIQSLFRKVGGMKNRTILIPLLEQHSIADIEHQRKVVEILKPLGQELEEFDIHVGFETELTATELISFLGGFGSSHFGVYYDVGNCTSYGFDCPEDIRKLSHRVKGIHLKDRKRNSTASMPLGTGDADFRGVFSSLTDIDWSGTLVMQAWRGEDYLNDAKTQLAFIRNIID